MNSLPQQAYYQIRGKIIAQEFAPGSALDKQQQLRQLRVAKTPLREALQRLALERLLVVAPQEGAFVSDLSIMSSDRLSTLACSSRSMLYAWLPCT